MWTLLLILALLTPPADPPPAARGIVRMYAPERSAPPAAPGEAWTIDVGVYATEPTTVTVGLQLDPRLDVLGIVATGADGQPAACDARTCVMPAAFWREASVQVTVRTAPDVWPCGPLLLRADASAAGLPDATVTRDRAIAGAEHCRAFPYTEGP